MEPTHPDRVVENVTAPSAGGFPGPDREVRLRMRLPFRTGSSLSRMGRTGLAQRRRGGDREDGVEAVFCNCLVQSLGHG
ncbi:MAG: hypothetical protein ACOX52_07065 [Verrucomicrobiota bacterium]